MDQLLDSEEFGCEATGRWDLGGRNPEEFRVRAGVRKTSEKKSSSGISRENLESPDPELELGRDAV